MAKFKKGDKVCIMTDVASSVIMPGEIAEVGLVEIIDGKTVYYLHGGDDWGFEEHEIALANKGWSDTDY